MKHSKSLIRTVFEASRGVSLVASQEGRFVMKWQEKKQDTYGGS
jgi:hypothetical protein